MGIAMNPTLFCMNEIDENWPIESRFYGPESVEYEQQISRIKRQYLNGINNDNHNSYEIIGDLDNESLHRPITIHQDYRKKNKIALYEQIESLLKQKMDKKDDIAKSRKVRTLFFNSIWKEMQEKGVNGRFQCDQKINKQILTEYAT